MPHTRYDHHDKEHAINVYIDLSGSYSDGPDDFIIRDHRDLVAGHQYVDLADDDPANADTILDVLRAIAERCPDIVSRVAAERSADAVEPWPFDRAETALRRPAPDDGE
jgi:hypothetical protein